MDMKLTVERREKKYFNPKVKPEGPYETQDQTSVRPVSNPELGRVIDFVEQFHVELNISFTIKSSYNEVPMLCNLMKNHLNGKLTTTTSLIASIFSKAKLDPTIINGGVIHSINNSAKLGKSEWCILESDESDGSFIKVPFTYSIVTNIWCIV